MCDEREMKKKPIAMLQLADIKREQIWFTNNVSWLGDPRLKRITYIHAVRVPSFLAGILCIWANI